MYGSPQLGPVGHSPAPQSSRGGFWQGFAVGVLCAVVAGLFVWLLAVGVPALRPAASPNRVALGQTSSPSQVLNSSSSHPRTRRSPTPSGGRCPAGAIACGSQDGVVIAVDSVNRDYQSPATLRRGYHRIRLLVTMSVNGKAQDLDPTQLTIHSGQDVDVLDVDAVLEDSQCQSAQGGIYRPGESLGPTPVCYQVAGPVNAPLQLVRMSSTDVLSPLTINLP